MKGIKRLVRFLECRDTKPFGEPAIRFRKKFSRLAILTLIAPKTR